MNHKETGRVILFFVKSLPWLVLADEKCIVVAEGFGLDELDDKIKETSIAK